MSCYEIPEDLLGDDGLFKQLKKALLERALGAELSEHLSSEKDDAAAICGMEFDCIAINA